MKIVNFGSCNLDYVYKLNHIVKTGETEHSERMEIFPGGKGLNQSIAIAKAGVPVYHAGCIGTDGQILISALEECGVDLTYVKKVNQPSGHAVIQVGNAGENAIFIHAGSNEMLTLEWIDSTLQNFDTGDFLLLQNEISNVGYIVEQAKKKGLVLFFNPSPVDETLRQVNFDRIDYLVLNEIEGEYLTLQKEPINIVSVLRERHPNLKVVLTIGEKGCIYCDGKSLHCHPAYEVPVVDSTAAGDAFMGYFVASLAQNLTEKLAIERACAASALVVSQKGAAPSIPYEANVSRALQILKAKPTDHESKNDQLKKQIDEYIEGHLQSANLSELAKILKYSTVYTGKLVKNTYRKSFLDCLQEKRCHFAAKLLLKTNLSVSEIINRIGYKNESFFREKFKETYGTTPAAYRKSLNSDSITDSTIPLENR